MSKYISTRMETINTLSLELNNLNSYFKSYIELLENISKEHKSFVVKNHKLISDYNSSIFAYTISLEFQFNSKKYILNVYFFNHIVANPDYPEELKHIMLPIVNQILQLEKFHIISNKLSNSRNLFHKIEKLYYEINKKTGNFNKESSIVLKYCKKLSEKQIIENEDQYTYIYLKPRKNHRMETIDFSTQKIKDNSSFQLKLPILKEIEKQYIQQRQNIQYNKNLYIKIFQEKFISLNPYFSKIFFIDPKNIYFNFSSQYQHLNREYHDITYELRISLTKEKIISMLKRLELEEQINNF